jgi:hypothetical protein
MLAAATLRATGWRRRFWVAGTSPAMTFQK